MQGSRQLRVVFLAYPRIGLNKGGLQLQIRSTARSLREIGCAVTLFDPWKDDLSAADVVHAFSVDGSLLPHLQRARQRNIPIVISPVFNGFDVPMWQTALKARLAKSVPAFYADLRRSQVMLDAADAVLPLNRQERRLLEKIFSVRRCKSTIVANGVDMLRADADPALFASKFKVHDFVLNVGSVEPRKNQLNLIRAMRHCPQSLVIIGPVEDHDRSYWRACQNAAGKNVLFVGPLDHDDPLLASAYAAASVFALPSLSEVMPLSLYEAASAGCACVVSHNVPVDDRIASYVKYVSPGDVRQIESAISCALKETRSSEMALITRSSLPTWSTIASQLMGVYEIVCMSRPRLPEVMP